MNRKRHTALWSAIILILSLGILWNATEPEFLPDGFFDELTGDAERGRRMFLIGGCASCHSAPGAEGEDRLVLSGGRRFQTDFGIFVAPNISPHPERGIGRWSVRHLGNAMLKGVSPFGRNYYPAFPYTSYARMPAQDVMDLFAYIKTLPKSDRPSEPHEVPFPFNMTRGLALWKALFLDSDPDPVVELPAGTPDAIRLGQYLVEGPGHCGECHTPRNELGAMIESRWLGGAPNPEGRGRIPNITPGGDFRRWTAGEIVYYLRAGLDPDFDAAGGTMVDVIANTSQLADGDLEAIAAYLKSIPAVSAAE